MRFGAYLCSVLAGVIVLALAGCGGSGALAGATVLDPQPQQANADRFAGAPGIPEDLPEDADYREASATVAGQREIDVTAPYSEWRTWVYEETWLAMAGAHGEDEDDDDDDDDDDDGGGGTEFAWAIFKVAGIDRPELGRSLNHLVLETSSPDPGFKRHKGDEYWLGLANFDEYAWEWYGPGNGIPEYELELTGLEYDFTSQLGNMYFIVVVPKKNMIYLRSAVVLYTDETADNQPPVASLSADPVSGEAPLLVSFDASASSDPDGDPLAYDWDIDGDGVFEQTDAGSTIQHTYAGPGNYTATVRVTDTGNASATAAVVITVDAAIPPYPVWEDLANMPRGRQHCVVLEYGDELIMCSGSGQGGSAPARHFDSYDTVTGTWTADAYPMIPAAHEGFAAAILNDKLYTMGGGWQTGSTDVFVLDLVSRTWSTGPSFNHLRANAYAVVVNGMIYLLNGAYSPGVDGNYVMPVEKFDPATQTWSVVATYPAARQAMSAVAVGDEIHILGEYAGPTRYPSHRIFNTISGVWSERTLPFQPSTIWTPVYADAEYLYTYFGIDNTTGRLNLGSGEWETGTPRSIPATGPCGAFVNGRIYMYHGGSWSNQFCAWAPYSDTFAPLPPAADPYWEQEANNDAGSANSMPATYHPVNDGYDFTGVTDTASDEDWYSVTIDPAEVYQVTWLLLSAGIPSGASLTITQYDSSLTQLDSRTLTSGNVCVTARSPMNVPITEVSYVRITGSAAGLEYDLSLAQMHKYRAGETLFESEPNNSAGQADLLPFDYDPDTDGCTYTSIFSSGDSSADWFQWNSTAPGYVVFHVMGYDYASNENVTVRLYNSQQQLLDTAVLGNNTGAVAVHSSSQLAAGTYYLSISPNTWTHRVDVSPHLVSQ